MWSRPQSGLQDKGYTYNVRIDIQTSPGIWAKDKQTIYKTTFLGSENPEMDISENYNFGDNKAQFIRLQIKRYLRSVLVKKCRNNALVTFVRTVLTGYRGFSFWFQSGHQTLI